MNAFIDELRSRNETLFYFSAILLVCALLFYALTKVTSNHVAGINAWYKPFKFALSIAIYCSTMAWYCYYLPSFNIKTFNWINILLFSFEMIYITLQASRGQESHFNQTTAVYRTLFAGMALAAIGIAMYAAYVGVLFFQDSLAHLPDYYVWAIRLSLLIFVIFSLQGLMMGGRQTHTVGATMQTTFLPFFKWNMKAGDLRVAHFIGMHALQIIPWLSFYVLKNTKLVFLVSLLYGMLATMVLIQALQGKPLITIKNNQHEVIN